MGLRPGSYAAQHDGCACCPLTEQLAADCQLHSPVGKFLRRDTPPPGELIFFSTPSSLDNPVRRIFDEQ
jgi:hypothetical protein